MGDLGYERSSLNRPAFADRATLTGMSTVLSQHLIRPPISIATIRFGRSPQAAAATAEALLRVFRTPSAA